MDWLAYAAMAAGLLPLVFMAVGYLYVSFTNEKGGEADVHGQKGYDTQSSASRVGSIPQAGCGGEGADPPRKR
jgi:hypothetical protein